MTTSWNHFSLPNPESSDSKGKVAPTTPLNLNLTNIAAPTEASKPVATASSGVVDFGIGLADGIGKQAWGTLTSTVGANADIALKNVQTGRNDGYGFLPLVGGLLHGLSSSVGVAIHNPSALLKLPGQLVSNFENGDARARGDIVGQTAFVISSFMVGGAGAANATKLAGDANEAATVARGADALKQVSANLYQLEAAARGVNGVGKLGDLSYLNQTTRGATAAEAGILRSGAVENPVGSVLGRAGAWSQRTLPHENPTEFLSPTARTSSLRVGESATSLSSRIVPNFLTGGNVPFVRSIRSTFTVAADSASSMATRLSQKLSPVVRKAEAVAGREATSNVNAAAAEASRIEASRLAAASHASRPIAEEIASSSSLGSAGVSLSTEARVARIAPHFDSLTADISAIRPTAVNALQHTALSGLEGTLARFRAAASDTELAGSARVRHLADVRDGVTSLNDAGLDTRVISNHLQTLQEQIFGPAALARTRSLEDGLVSMNGQAEKVISSAGLLAVQAADHGAEAVNALREIKDASQQLGAANDTLSRSRQLARLDKSMAVLQKEMGPNLPLKTIVDKLKTEAQTVQRASRIDTSIAAIPEQAGSVIKQTGALRGLGLAEPSQRALADIETAASRLQQPLTDAERDIQLTRLFDQTKSLDHLGREAAPLRRLVSTIENEAETAQRLTTIDKTLAELPAKSDAVIDELSNLRRTASGSADLEQLLDSLQQATRQLVQEPTGAGSTGFVQQIEKGRIALEAALGPKATSALTEATEGLTKDVSTVGKLSSYDAAVDALPEKVKAVSSASDKVRAAAVAKGSEAVNALNTVQETAADLSRGSAIDRASAYTRLRDSLAIVERELGPEAATLRQSVVDLQAADRSATIEKAIATGVTDGASVQDLTLINQTTKLAGRQAQVVSSHIDSLRTANSVSSGTKLDSALTNLERVSSRTAKADVSLSSEEVAQISSDLAVVEDSVGSQASAPLRSATLAMQKTALTADRMTVLEQSVRRISGSTERVGSSASLLDGLAAERGSNAVEALNAVRDSALALGKAVSSDLVGDRVATARLADVTTDLAEAGVEVDATSATQPRGTSHDEVVAADSVATAKPVEIESSLPVNSAEVRTVEPVVSSQPAEVRAVELGVPVRPAEVRAVGLGVPVRPTEVVTLQPVEPLRPAELKADAPMLSPRPAEIVTREPAGTAKSVEVAPSSAPSPIARGDAASRAEQTVEPVTSAAAASSVARDADALRRAEEAVGHTPQAGPIGSEFGIAKSSRGSELNRADDVVHTADDSNAVRPAELAASQLLSANKVGETTRTVEGIDAAGSVGRVDNQSLASGSAVDGTGVDTVRSVEQVADREAGLSPVGAHVRAANDLAVRPAEQVGVEGQLRSANTVGEASQAAHKDAVGQATRAAVDADDLRSAEQIGRQVPPVRAASDVVPAAEADGVRSVNGVGADASSMRADVLAREAYTVGFETTTAGGTGTETIVARTAGAETAGVESVSAAATEGSRLAADVAQGSESARARLAAEETSNSAPHAGAVVDDTLKTVNQANAPGSTEAIRENASDTRLGSDVASRRAANFADNSALNSTAGRELASANSAAASPLAKALSQGLEQIERELGATAVSDLRRSVGDLNQEITTARQLTEVELAATDAARRSETVSAEIDKLRNSSAASAGTETQLALNNLQNIAERTAGSDLSLTGEELASMHKDLIVVETSVGTDATAILRDSTRKMQEAILRTSRLNRIMTARSSALNSLQSVERESLLLQAAAAEKGPEVSQALSMVREGSREMVEPLATMVKTEDALSSEAVTNLSEGAASTQPSASLPARTGSPSPLRQTVNQGQIGRADTVSGVQENLAVLQRDLGPQATAALERSVLGLRVNMIGVDRAAQLDSVAFDVTRQARTVTSELHSVSLAGNFEEGSEAALAAKNLERMADRAEHGDFLLSSQQLKQMQGNLVSIENAAGVTLSAPLSEAVTALQKTAVSASRLTEIDAAVTQVASSADAVAMESAALQARAMAKGADAERALNVVQKTASDLIESAADRSIAADSGSAAIAASESAVAASKVAATKFAESGVAASGVAASGVAASGVAESRVAESNVAASNVARSTQASGSGAGLDISAGNQLQRFSGDGIASIRTMQENLAIVERELGPQATANLRHRVQTLRDGAADADRLITMDAAAETAGQHAQLVKTEASVLRSNGLITQGSDADLALAGLQQTAARTAIGDTSFTRDELALIGKNLATVERSVGTEASQSLRSTVSGMNQALVSTNRIAEVSENIDRASALVKSVNTEASLLEVTAAAKGPRAMRALNAVRDYTNELFSPLSRDLTPSAMASLEVTGLQTSGLARVDAVANLQENLLTVERELGPEVVTKLKQNVADAQRLSATSARLDRIDASVAATREQSQNVGAAAASLRTTANVVESSATDLALTNIRRIADRAATSNLSISSNEISQLDRDLSLVEKSVGTELSSPLSASIADVRRTASTTSRLTNMDEAASRVASSVQSVSREAGSLETSAAEKGSETVRALNAVRERAAALEYPTWDNSLGTGALSREETLTSLRENLAVVSRQLGPEADRLRTSVVNLEREAAVSDRLSLVDTQAKNLASQSQAVTSGASLLRLTAALPDESEAGLALSRLQDVVHKTAGIDVSASRDVFDQIGKDLSSVQDAVGAEASAPLRRSVADLRTTASAAARSSTIERAYEQVRDAAQTVDKEVAGLASLATSKGPETVEALRTVQMTANEISVLPALERQSRSVSLDKSSALVESQLGGDATALSRSVDALQSNINSAERLVKVDQSLTAAASSGEKSEQILAAIKSSGAIESGSEAERALMSLTRKIERSAVIEPVVSVNGLGSPELTVLEKALGSQAMQPLRESLQEMQLTRITAQTSQRVSDALVQVGEKASAVLDETKALRSVSEARPALRDTLTDVHTAAIPAGPEVAPAVETSTSTLNFAVPRTGPRIALETDQMRAEEALTNIEKSASHLRAAADSALSVEVLSSLDRDAGVLEKTLGPKATSSLRTAVSRLESQSSTAIRLRTVEDATSHFLKQAESVNQEIALIQRSAARGSEEDLSLASLKRSVEEATYVSDVTVRSVQFTSINKSLAAIERASGEQAVAGLRTSVARMEAQAGTVERLAHLDHSFSQLDVRVTNLNEELNALRATAPGARAEAVTALDKIENSANQVSRPSRLFSRKDLLLANGSDIGAVERELGTEATKGIRQSLADVDLATAQVRRDAVELLDYQGAKANQTLSYLQGGNNLGSYQQIQRIEQLQHDLGVMRIVVPSESNTRAILSNVEHQVAGVDAVSNILSHPEVARAGLKQLSKLVQSGDQGTAIAAADRLVLKGRAEVFEAPAAGLISERQAFWNSQKRLAQLTEKVTSRAFESGKIFGLPLNDASSRRLLVDASVATLGLAVFANNAGYNLNRAVAIARDKELSEKAGADTASVSVDRGHSSAQLTSRAVLQPSSETPRQTRDVVSDMRSHHSVQPTTEGVSRTTSGGASQTTSEGASQTITGGASQPKTDEASRTTDRASQTTTDVYSQTTSDKTSQPTYDRTALAPSEAIPLERPVQNNIRTMNGAASESAQQMPNLAPRVANTLFETAPASLSEISSLDKNPSSISDSRASELEVPSQPVGAATSSLSAQFGSPYSAQNSSQSVSYVSSNPVQPSVLATPALSAPQATSPLSADMPARLDFHISTQSVFNAKSEQYQVSPILTVYGTPRYSTVQSDSFPIMGASWRWLQEHGGNPWGFARHAGVPPEPEETLMPTPLKVARARGIAAGSDSDLIKIAQTQFIIPRITDARSQYSLLSNPMALNRTKSGNGIGSGGIGNRSWQTTVDWSQIGNQKGKASGRVPGLKGVELGAEGNVDGSGGSASTTQQDPNSQAALVRAGLSGPQSSGPNEPTSAQISTGVVDPNTVTASNTTSTVAPTNRKSEEPQILAGA